MNKFLPSLSVLVVVCAAVFSANAQEIKGDIKAGEKKIAMCIGCHGIKGYQARAQSTLCQHSPPTKKAIANTPPCAVLLTT